MSDWTWTQSDRLGQIGTVLGQDIFLLKSFVATERFSRPFSIEVEVLAGDPDIDFAPHLGTGVSLTISGGANASDEVTGGDENLKRNFHGVLFEAERIDLVMGEYAYRLQLRPWLSLLDLGRNSRIFQNMSVKDIIDKVFSGAGFTGYTIKVSKRGITPRNYCVQFRESDFSFVSRLMEEEGIYYYFDHTADSHTMMICDDPTSHPDFAVTANVILGEESRGAQGGHLWSWGPYVQPSLSKVSLRDVHFSQADKIFTSTSEASSSVVANKGEHYDFPGGFGYYADDGNAPNTYYSEDRMLNATAVSKILRGAGDVFSIPVGSRLSVKDGDAAAAKYLVISAIHTFGVDLTATTATTNDTGLDDFKVQFEAIPDGVPWRPERRTPKPQVGGPQTAVVVGASGEVIEVDKYGRVHVQFPWDRIGTLDSNSSCWLRVSQSSADGGFGHMHIPRIGEEVIVDFLEGDPDRPIITGRVYNSTHMPPYTLPDEKTKSTWKSQTVGDSGSYDETENPPSGKGSNEIRFEDKGGSEEVYIHAQRDLNAWYRHDEIRKTGRDTSVRVGRNRETAVKKNETLTVETGDETRKISQGSRQTTIEKADSLTLNSGDYSMKVSAGQATIEAMQKITLKVGTNQIVISQQGIEITGLTVKMTATTTLAVQGLTSDFKADTMLTVGGAIVMIN